MQTNVPISSVLHIAMVGFTIGLMLLAILIGHLSKQAGKLSTFDKLFGWTIFVLWLVYNAYYFAPQNFDWKVSLPLHVCDLLAPIASIALLANSRTARSLTYFCALTMAGQAVYTPIGNQDPTTLRFWLFWILHAAILASFSYDLVIRGYRPRSKDLYRVISLSILYIVVMTPINIAFGWNYGYLGDSKPDAPTAIDVLGPWPARIAWIFLLSAGLQVAMYIPWKVARISRWSKDDLR
jgi:hypothetical integral membrane protein (TIGR02206 family)